MARQRGSTRPRSKRGWKLDPGAIDVDIDRADARTVLAFRSKPQEIARLAIDAYFERLVETPDALLDNDVSSASVDDGLVDQLIEAIAAEEKRRGLKLNPMDADQYSAMSLRAGYLLGLEVGRRVRPRGAL